MPREFSLANVTNDFAAVTATAGGAVTIADSGALSVTGITASGDILVSTQTGDLTVTGAVATTSTTATALRLEAGSAANRVASAGIADTSGNVIIDGGSLAVGAGGSGTIFTGSITGSTGLAAAVTAGNFRYWSDTNGDTGYTTALTAGIGAVYREQPVVTVTATASGSGRAYDGTTTVPTLAITGEVNGETGSGTGALAITTGGNPATLLNAGSYTLGLTGAGAGAVLGGLGYAAQAGSSSSYVITRASVSVTGIVATDKSYDGTRTASLSSIGTLTGLVGLETLTLTATAASFADANAGPAQTVTVTGYAIANGTGLASNYVLAGTTATTMATIDQATLTASLIGTVAKTYDATTVATLGVGNYQLTGVIGSDVVTLNDPDTGAYATANAGTGITVTVGGLALGGATANYQLASASISGAIGSIGLAPLLVRANDASRHASAANPVFSATLTGLLGADTAAAVSGLQFASSATFASLAGTYLITVSGGTALDYSLTYQPGMLTVTAATVVVPPVVVPPVVTVPVVVTIPPASVSVMQQMLADAISVMQQIPPATVSVMQQMPADTTTGTTLSAAGALPAIVIADAGTSGTLTSGVMTVTDPLTGVQMSFVQSSATQHGEPQTPAPAPSGFGIGDTLVDVSSFSLGKKQACHSKVAMSPGCP